MKHFALFVFKFPQRLLMNWYYTTLIAVAEVWRETGPTPDAGWVYGARKPVLEMPKCGEGIPGILECTLPKGHTGAHSQQQFPESK